MLIPEIREAIENTRWNLDVPNPGTAHALEYAINRLVVNGASDDDLQVAKMLMAVLDQRGCEHLDGAVNDGRLVSFIDVLVYG